MMLEQSLIIGMQSGQIRATHARWITWGIIMLFAALTLFSLPMLRAAIYQIPIPMVSDTYTAGK